MKIQIDSVIYEGTAVEILNSLRDQIFDPTEFPDTAARGRIVLYRKGTWKPRPKLCCTI